MSERPDEDDDGTAWDDDDPIVAEQPSTWVYWNTRGQVVIRQRGEVFEDDPYVLFGIEHVPTLIAALRQKVIEWNTPDEHPEPQIAAKPAKQPLSNAERQRRHKRRHRIEKGNEGNAEGNDEGTGGNELLLPGDQPAIPFPGDDPR